MKIQLTFIFMMVAISMQAQEFLTSIIIENSINERDTVYIGYDSTATIQIDTQFGESDILNMPFNESFDVRLSQIDVEKVEYGVEFWNDMNVPDLILYQSKIDILPRSCMDYDQASTIDGWPPHSTLFIPIDNLPIEISWDSEQFQNECLNSSFFTLWAVNTWWDTQGFLTANPFGQWYTMNDNSSLTINQPVGHQYITESNDTLMMLFLILNDTEDLFLDTDQVIYSSDINIFPNPTHHYIDIKHEGSEKYKEYEILNKSGERVSWGKYDHRPIDVQLLASGVYFIKLQDKDGKGYVNKFVKW